MTAINISYLKNAASQHKSEWEDKYKKACEYLFKQIGDKDAKEKLLECADKDILAKKDIYISLSVKQSTV